MVGQEDLGGLSIPHPLGNGKDLEGQGHSRSKGSEVGALME